jgi:hypothetical protein
MRVTFAVPEIPAEAVLAAIDGLPAAEGSEVHVKYLRCREKPHLSAWTDFDAKTITEPDPEPFFPFRRDRSLRRAPSSRHGTDAVHLGHGGHHLPQTTRGDAIPVLP